MSDHLHLTVDYEPSKETKKLWLSTRKNSTKNEYEIAGFSQKLTHYGLFDTHGYPLDRFLFILAMLLEFVGMAILAIIAEGGYLLWGSLGVAIVIDIAVAIGLHVKKGEICEYENKEVVARFNNEKDKAEACSERVAYLKGWWFSQLCVFLLWAFSLTKSFTFFMLNGGDVFAILMALFYLAIAYIHAYHTGYFLASRRLRRQIRKEQKQHLAALLANKTTLNSVIDYRFDEIAAKSAATLKEVHKFKSDGGSAATGGSVPRRENAIFLDTADQTWKFKTWGVLTDNELNDLVADQPSAERGIVTLKGIEAQLSMLTKNAKR